MAARPAKRVTVEPFNAPVTVVRSRAQWEAVGEEKGSCLGFVKTQEGRWILGLPWKYDEETLWHEAHHLARWLNAHYGVPTDADQHESDVYLQESIVRLVKTTVYGKKL